MARESDKNQLELGKVGLRPYIYLIHLVVLYENYIICIFMKINEKLKNEDKTIGKTNTRWVYRTILNS